MAAFSALSKLVALGLWAVAGLRSVFCLLRRLVEVFKVVEKDVAVVVADGQVFAVGAERCGGDALQVCLEIGPILKGGEGGHLRDSDGVLLPLGEIDQEVSGAVECEARDGGGQVFDGSDGSALDLVSGSVDAVHVDEPIVGSGHQVVPIRADSERVARDDSGIIDHVENLSLAEVPLVNFPLPDGKEVLLIRREAGRLAGLALLQLKLELLAPAVENHDIALVVHQREVVARVAAHELVQLLGEALREQVAGDLLQLV